MWRWLRSWSILLLLLSVAYADDQSCASNEGGVCQDDAPANNNSDNACPTQTSLALEMARLSYPKAHAKLKHIFTNHPNFYVDMGGTQKVFDTVAENMVTALRGYGLHETQQHDTEGVLRVETFFSGNRKARDMDTKAILFLQTEQICCSRYGQIGLPYLEKCHASPSCLVWEYSQTNLEFLQEKGLGDSVLLVPFLHQQRLDPYYPTDVPRLGARPIDVVFFGVMTPRRTHIQQQLAEVVAHHKLDWNLLLEEVGNSGSHLDYMASKYLESKICLIIHGFGDQTPGEYHRLSELAGSGCLPVVETFGDKVGMDTYQQCGGVVFSNLGNLPNVIMTVLQTISPHESFAIDRRLGWWNQRIEWDRLLQLLVELDVPSVSIGEGVDETDHSNTATS